MKTSLKHSAASKIKVLGAPEIPIYLVAIGSQWLLIEAGVASLTSLVLQQLIAIVGDLNRVRHWIITHSHYDHVGMLPYLLPHLPNVIVHGRHYIATVFQSDKAIAVIESLNTQVPRKYWGANQRSEMEPLASIHYKDIKLEPLYEGKYLEFGDGKKLLVMATPGHSRCSTSFLLEPEGVLFVSDSLGEMISADVWLPLVFDSAEQYEQSIHLLKNIEANYLALGHHGMLPDKLAKARTQALNSYYDFREFYVQGTANGKPTEQMVEDLCDDYGQKSQSLVPHSLLVASMQRMLQLFEQCENKG